MAHTDSAKMWEWNDFWAYFVGSETSCKAQMVTQVSDILGAMLPRITRKIKVEVLENAPNDLLKTLVEKDLIDLGDLKAIERKGRNITVIIEGIEEY